MIIRKKSSPVSFRPPLFAMARGEDGGVIQLGGPFEDIDDVLDCCWDHILGNDLSVDRTFLIETTSNGPVRREFPRGAFPEQDDSGDDA